MDPIRKTPKKFAKKSGNIVIDRQYFSRKTALKSCDIVFVPRTIYLGLCLANGFVFRPIIIILHAPHSIY